MARLPRRRTGSPPGSGFGVGGRRRHDLLPAAQQERSPARRHHLQGPGTVALVPGGCHHDLGRGSRPPRGATVSRGQPVGRDCRRATPPQQPGAAATADLPRGGAEFSQRLQRPLAAARLCRLGQRQRLGRQGADGVRRLARRALGDALPRRGRSVRPPAH
ncbi:hypothetical protein HZS92_03448 [Xanthomonas citri pv. citri]|nr:hypothetical protein HZS92_03448 [Xanthomonas citri pv. citri]